MPARRCVAFANPCRTILVVSLEQPCNANPYHLYVSDPKPSKRAHRSAYAHLWQFAHNALQAHCLHRPAPGNAHSARPHSVCSRRACAICTLPQGCVCTRRMRGDFGGIWCATNDSHKSLKQRSTLYTLPEPRSDKWSANAWGALRNRLIQADADGPVECLARIPAAPNAAPMHGVRVVDHLRPGQKPKL